MNDFSTLGAEHFAESLDITGKRSDPAQHRAWIARSRDPAKIGPSNAQPGLDREGRGFTGAFRHADNRLDREALQTPPDLDDPPLRACDSVVEQDVDDPRADPVPCEPPDFPSRRVALCELLPVALRTRPRQRAVRLRTERRLAYSRMNAPKTPSVRLAAAATPRLRLRRGRE